MPESRVFRFEDLPVDRPMPGLERRRIMGEKAMISHVRLFKGCDVPVHQHENEQFSWVISGRVRFVLRDGRTTDLGAGQGIYFPGNEPHGALALEETLILDVFAPPSAMTGIDRR